MTQDLVRSGLVALLSAAEGIEVVAEGRDGIDAVRIVIQQQPDVALVDIRMPRMNGLEAIR